MAIRSQQQADPLVQLADNVLASGMLPLLRGCKPQVIVTIGHEDLMDARPGHGAARTGSGARISAARARMLACDGAVTRIVFGPDGQQTDLGRELRPLRRGPPRACEWWGAEWSFHSPVATPRPGGATWPCPDFADTITVAMRPRERCRRGQSLLTYRPDGTEILMPEPLRAA